MGEQQPKQQLKMVWPAALLDAPPPVQAPAGYRLRTHQPGDEAEFFQVMELAGFRGWDYGTLEPWLKRILPDGWFMACRESDGAMVATAMATHNPSSLFPFGGELGWVAGHPNHAGRGLGRLVCAAVVRRFLDAGYRTIYLKTDDRRLPALCTYLKLGFVPLLDAADMPERWHVVCAQLHWPYTPQDWPRAGFP